MTPQDRIYSIHAFLHGILAPSDHDAVRNDMREVVAALDAAPAWHDIPTVPGDWVTLHNGVFVLCRLLDDSMVEEWAEHADEWDGRVYGPIPQDQKEKQ